MKENELIDEFTIVRALFVEIHVIVAAILPIDALIVSKIKE
jgi:hypothetical protein